MKKLVFLGACLVALNVSPVLAQATAPLVAVVSIQYAWDGLGAGYLLIDRNGKVERKNIQNTAFMTPLTADQMMSMRANMLRQTVAQLYQEGYMLKASLGHKEIDELIFVKEK